MRSIWSGTLSFGLVNIPVRLYVASEEHGLDLSRSSSSLVIAAVMIILVIAVHRREGRRMRHRPR